MDHAVEAHAAAEYAGALSLANRDAEPLLRRVHLIASVRPPWPGASAEVAHTLGLILLRARRYPEAVALMQSEVSTAPVARHGELCSLLGHALLTQGQHAAARSAFLDALRLQTATNVSQPEALATLHARLAETCAAMGLMNDAAAHRESARRMAPGPSPRESIPRRAR